MGETVSDFVLQRLTAWGIKRVYGYPGDGMANSNDRGCKRLNWGTCCMVVEKEESQVKGMKEAIENV